MTKPTLRLVLVLAALLSSALGCRTAEVVRVVDGVEAPGRFISDRAYAAFLVGAEWEARARYEDALSAYLVAVGSDPDSVEIHSRLGWLWCMVDRGDEAREAFDEAVERDPRYEPTWRRQALCAEHEGRLEDALVASTRAVALDPERDGTVLIHAHLLGSLGRHDEAWPWLRGLSLRSPASEDVWEAIAEHTAERKPAWASLARRRLAELRDRLGPHPGAERRLGWLDVDETLVDGDLPGARRRARQAHLDTRLLAARALLVGRPELARDEAQLRVDADPSDAGARIVLALAADMLGDEAAARRALMGLSGRRVDPVSALLMAELLLRRVGPEAAGLWLGSDRGGLTVEGLRRRARDAFGSTDRHHGGDP